MNNNGENNTTNNNEHSNRNNYNNRANNNSSSNNNKIEIKKIFEKSDKNKIGFLSCKEVRNILTGLNIPDMTEEDIDYIIISLDIEKNGQLVYKGFVSLLE